MIDKYEKFLINLKDRDFSFCNFRDLFSMDWNNLPKRLVVIRHDIHYRDIRNVQNTIEIEKRTLGKVSSTFFVLWNYVEYPDNYLESDPKVIKSYENLIEYCIKEKIDVQPHISPLNMHIAEFHPAWAEMHEERLKNIFKRNYIYSIDKDKLGTLKLLENMSDQLGLFHMNSNLPRMLREYNKKWKERFGIPVQGYAAHGASNVSMNKVFNNAWILNQKFLLEEKIYEYDAYNGKIGKILNYLSDNDSPDWMIFPEKVEARRHQLLHHPKLWETL